MSKKESVRGGVFPGRWGSSAVFPHPLSCVKQAETREDVGGKIGRQYFCAARGGGRRGKADRRCFAVASPPRGQHVGQRAYEMGVDFVPFTPPRAANALSPALYEQKTKRGVTQVVMSLRSFGADACLSVERRAVEETYTDYVLGLRPC